MKITFGKGFFLAMASLALLATSCTTDEALPSETAYEHASDSDLNDVIQNNLGGIYEFGETYEHGILERVPMRYEKCGDTVDGFRYDTHDTSMVLIGDAISAEELRNALDAKDLSVMRPVEVPKAKHTRSTLGAWVVGLPLMHFFLLLVLGILAILGLLWLVARILRDIFRSYPPTPPAANQPLAPIHSRVMVTNVPEEPNEFEGVYENGDTRMSLWVKGPRPKAFVLSYQKGDGKPETLSFKPEPQKEEEAPPA